MQTSKVFKTFEVYQKFTNTNQLPQSSSFPFIFTNHRVQGNRSAKERVNQTAEQREEESAVTQKAVRLNEQNRIHDELQRKQCQQVFPSEVMQ